MKTKLFFMACTAMLLFSCGNGNQSLQTTSRDIQLDNVKQEKKKFEDKAAIADSTRIADDNTAPTPPESQQVIPTKIITDWDKKIIKTADIKLELKDYSSYNNALHKNLKSFGAYISKEEQSQQDDILQNNVEIKVPVDQFDNLVNSFNGEGMKVIEKKISTDDVTSEYVDGKARLEAKKQVRLQYLQLLKQAKNMKDILEVQNEINNIQEEIESVNGRINYLSHQAAYSTINLNYYQLISGKNPFNNHPNFFTRTVDAFKDGLSIIGSLIISLISIWPILLLGILAVLIYRRRKWKTFKSIQH